MAPISWDKIKAATRKPVGPVKRKDLDNLGFNVMTLEFSVPLDHNKSGPKDPKLQISAELVYTPKYAASNCEAEYQARFSDNPKGSITEILVYLCGGPGDGNKPARIPGLNQFAKDCGLDILYPNYRGCENSGSDITANTPTEPLTATYLAHFRQDAIVADLEAIRKCLNNVKFILIGQSFGGWIATTYLSFCPGGLEGVYLTAGLPPVGQTPESVYKALYARLCNKNKNYYNTYPGDREKIIEIVKALARSEGGKGLKLPDETGKVEQWLTARGFLTMGRRLGGPDGPKEVHDWVQSFFSEFKETGKISRSTVDKFVENDASTFRLPDRPLYGVLHEAIYIAGPDVASNWAAQEVVRKDRSSHFEWLQKGFNFLTDITPDMELYFSGEMIHPFMLDDAGEKLERFKEVARELAQKKDWPHLYDENALRVNKVPVKAMIFDDDIFVDPELSRQTVKKIGECVVIRPKEGMTHGSIKKDTKEVLELLFGRVQGQMS
ncbi:hypothetical protein N0V88_007605 [Collariella sp. IMI 366227]|nr:hypothetical protein N0V88_007605 [Collariella sp. IMI 366227]